MATVDHAQGHMDPTKLPQWLVDAAKEERPAVLGWMAAAYLAGVQVGQKAGPCMNQVEGIFPTSALTCTLHAGHAGGHSDGVASWIERPTVPEVPDVDPA